MNIPQLLGAYRKIELHEMADNDRVGLEVCAENIPNAKMSLQTLQYKIKWMIHYIDTTDKSCLQGYKISNIRTITFVDDFTQESKCYSVSLCIGDTDSYNRVLPSQHGLYHMKYGRNKHWAKSKRSLNNINNFIKGTVQYCYQNQVQQKDRVVVLSNKDKYVIGLAGNPLKNETVLITCYTI